MILRFSGALHATAYSARITGGFDKVVTQSRLDESVITRAVENSSLTIEPINKEGYSHENVIYHRATYPSSEVSVIYTPLQVTAKLNLTVHNLNDNKQYYFYQDSVFGDTFTFIVPDGTTVMNFEFETLGTKPYYTEEYVVIQIGEGDQHGFFITYGIITIEAIYL